MTIRGTGTAVIEGVTPQEVFDFVLDPAQYRKADTKIIDVRKLAATADGMLAREDGLFLGRFRGSIITRYRWEMPRHIDVTLVHGVPESVHAWFNIERADDGTRLEHVEEMQMGHGFLGRFYDWIAAGWFASAVEQEVAEIARLMREGERGRGISAHGGSL
jgi:Polyketide cyclase / dehydrase and lipid transport